MRSEMSSTFEWWSAKTSQNSKDAALRDHDAEHVQFGMNARRSPQGISHHRSFDQSSSLPSNSWPTPPAAVWFRQPGPEPAERLALPLDHRGRLDINKWSASTEPDRSE